MSDKAPSERRLIADRIAAFICQQHLNNPFGGDVELSQDRKHYSILMSVPRLLDGQVRVYGPKFILINMQGPLARHGGAFVYESEGAALAFLRLMLVEHDADKALRIPQKPEKAKKQV